MHDLTVLQKVFGPFWWWHFHIATIFYGDLNTYMGFKFKETADGKCTFQAIAEGDDRQCFLICVQTALKSLRLDITVDVSQNAMALGAILPDLLKLQKMVSVHHRSVTIRGLMGKVPSEFLDRLSGYGLVIAETKMDQPPAKHLSVRESAVIVAPPDATVVVQRFHQLQERLAETRKLHALLSGEKASYLQRLDRLSQTGSSGNGQEGQVTQEQIDEIADLESQIVLLKDEQQKFAKRIEEASVEAAKLKENLSKATADTQKQYSEKKKATDKKIADLIKAREKATAEHKKKVAEQQKKTGP
jgi:hypothetical protein